MLSVGGTFQFISKHVAIKYVPERYAEVYYDVT